MAYRKTEKVLAEITGRRDIIVASAIDIISKLGIDALTTAEISKRSNLSVGLIYKHFADFSELRAFMFAQLLARDLELIRAAGNLPGGIRAWARQLASDARITTAVARDAAYRDGIKKELAKQIKAAGGDSPAILAAVVCGAVIEASGSLRPRDEIALTTALLRAIGTPSKVTA